MERICVYYSRKYTHIWVDSFGQWLRFPLRRLKDRDELYEIIQQNINMDMPYEDYCLLKKLLDIIRGNVVIIDNLFNQKSIR